MNVALVGVVLVGLAAIGLCVAQIALAQKTNLVVFTIGGAALTLVVGLLGTIVSLIQIFDVVATADPSQKSAMLAEGISQAMHSTAAGIGLQVVIIPLLVIGIAKHRPPASRSRALTVNTDAH